MMNDVLSSGKTDPLAGAEASILQVRASAMYLPKFHPVPLNAHHYGDGFTEWTHVRATKTPSPRHRQLLQTGKPGHRALDQTDQT